MVLRRWEADVSSVSPSSERMIRSDEGLTLETSASQSLYGGQFTLSTPLIYQIFVNQIEPELNEFKNRLNFQYRVEKLV